MNFVVSCSGCLTSIILLSFLALLFKFSGILILILLVYLIWKKKYAWAQQIMDFIKPKEKNIKKGKIYKQCSFCGTKTDRNEAKCPKCKKSFEE